MFSSDIIPHLKGDSLNKFVSKKFISEIFRTHLVLYMIRCFEKTEGNNILQHISSVIKLILENQ